jgi:transcriptional regulator with XRE-family HTH domain
MCYTSIMLNLASMRNSIREELRLALYSKKISITRVGEYLGVSRVQASRILNGESDTTFDNWEKIASLVGKVFVLEDMKKSK